MQKQNNKKHNHLYPHFHTQKWKKCNGKIYEKETNKTREIDCLDFSEEYYYSNGLPDQTLEDRLAKFETYIGNVIKRVDESIDTICLSGKELELLKLYVVLCANRHHYSVEVINHDESGVYQSNNFLFGVSTIDRQEEVIKVVSKIMDDFDRIVKLANDEQFSTEYRVITPQYTLEKSSASLMGLHLAIVRSSEPCLLVSACVAITENTMDGDYLYTYVPISPTTALLLVKSKYYFDLDTFTTTKEHFGQKYGSGSTDPFISEIFGGYKGELDCENKLFCSYAYVKSAVHIQETYLKNSINNRFNVKINTLPKPIFQMFNSLYYEDGKKILFVNIADLEHAKTSLECRKIAIG